MYFIFSMDSAFIFLLLSSVLRKTCPCIPIISQHWYSTGIENHHYWWHVVNIIGTDNGAKATIVMALTQLSCDILISVPERRIYFLIQIYCGKDYFFSQGTEVLMWLNDSWYFFTHKQRVLMHSAQASRVKCPARFVSHLHEIFIYIWVVYSFCLFCCLFIIVTWWYMWCIVWQVASKRKYRHVW